MATFKNNIFIRLLPVLSGHVTKDIEYTVFCSYHEVLENLWIETKRQPYYNTSAEPKIKIKIQRATDS
jgi:hypothetical protein